MPNQYHRHISTYIAIVTWVVSLTATFWMTWISSAFFHLVVLPLLLVALIGICHWEVHKGTKLKEQV